jgi:hypothetical protein
MSVCVLLSERDECLCVVVKRKGRRMVDAVKL